MKTAFISRKACRGGILRTFALLLAVCLLFSLLPVSAFAKSYTCETGTYRYRQNKNLFMGKFHNYQPDPMYIKSLRNKYPDDVARYGDDSFTPYVNELLTLYLADLEDAGYRFGVIEREDMCSEQSYVVELTENGASAIQIAFVISETDPKAATMVALGCVTDGYRDLDTLNYRLGAIWMAMDTFNVHMTPEKHEKIIDNSETTTDEVLGVVNRGAIDGLGYLSSINEKNFYLVLSPDLTLPFFEGMKTGVDNLKNLNEGDTFFFGSYEQGNDVTNGAEAIEWIILAKESDRVLVISAMALDSKRFNHTAGNVSWQNSSVRSWLNNDFYNTAFDEDEQERILAERMSWFAPKDSVFLLSREEVETFFPTNSQRLCEATKYAVAQGAYVNAKTGGSWWLLRTAGTTKGNVMSVNSDGSMDYNGGRVASDKGTVRPAMWISTK